jgi:hypothetical protein
MNQQEKEGYVENSVVDIWTEVDFTDPSEETINILHIHINDTSE